MAEKTTSCSLCDSDDEHYQAQGDARSLEEAQEVRGDDKRHKNAMAHLKKKADDTKKAVENEAKVKKGLAAAFPKDGDDTGSY